MFIFSTPELIGNLWQLNTAILMHWCLICAVQLITFLKCTVPLRRMIKLLTHSKHSSLLVQGFKLRPKKKFYVNAGRSGSRWQLNSSALSFWVSLPDSSSNILSWYQCYKTFYDRNLRRFIIMLECLSQASHSSRV